MADYCDSTIRKIAWQGSDWVVTTIAGLLACGLAIAIERHRELIQSNEPDYRRLRDRLRRLTSERQPPAQMSVR